MSVYEVENYKILTDWKESCIRSIFLKTNLLLFAQELVLLRLPNFHFLCAFSSILTYICLHIAQQQSISAPQALQLVSFSTLSLRPVFLLSTPPRMY